MADGDFKVKNGLLVGGKADIVYDTDLSLGSSGIVYAGTTAPSSPQVGDLWINSAEDSKYSNYFRWRKTAVGGETSLSGADDFGITLAYLAGNEQLFINGVLQYRGSDYTATDGSTITGITALTANDIIDVIAVNQTTLNQLTLYSSTAPDSPQTGTLWVDTSQVVNDTANYLDHTDSTGFKIKLLMENFKIWQRGTSQNLTTSFVYGSADRWTALMGATAAGTFSQITSSSSPIVPPTSFRYAAKLGRNSASTSTGVLVTVQALETNDSIPLQGEIVTLSLWMKSGANLSANVGIQLVSGTGIDQSAATYGTWTNATSIVNAAVTPSSISSWTRVSYSASVPATSTQLAVVIYYFPTGTAGADDSVYFTGVQLEANPVVTAFESRSYQQELSLCQRYYYRLNSDPSYLYTQFGIGGSVSATAAGSFIRNPVTMRTIPTSIDTTATASNYGVSNSIGNIIALSSLPTLGGNNRSADHVTLTLAVASGLTAGTVASFNASNSSAAYIGISAEL